MKHVPTYIGEYLRTYIDSLYLFTFFHHIYRMENYRPSLSLVLLRKKERKKNMGANHSVEDRLKKLEKRYKACNQGHVLENVDTLTSEQKLELVNQLESIPVENLEGWLESAKSKCDTSSSPEEEEAYSPYEGPVACVKDSSKEQLMEWERMGRTAIEEGTAAAVLLAGGQ